MMYVQLLGTVFEEIRAISDGSKDCPALYAVPSVRFGMFCLPLVPSESSLQKERNTESGRQVYYSMTADGVCTGQLQRTNGEVCESHGGYSRAAIAREHNLPYHRLTRNDNKEVDVHLAQGS